MDQIKSQLDRLADLNDSEVSDLQSQIVTEFEQVEGEDPTPQSVETMTELANMLDTVRGEVKRREAQAEELASLAAEASARVKGGDNPGEQIVENDPSTPTGVGPEGDLPGDQIPPAPGEDPADEALDQQNGVPEGSPADEAIDANAPKNPNPFDKKKNKNMASTDADVASEFSTEENVTEASVTADDTQEASNTDESTPDTTPETEAATEAPVEASTETPVEAEASTSDDQIIVNEQIAQEEAPVTAAAEGTFEAPADRRPVAKTVAPKAITAGADVPGYTAGSALSNLNEVAEAMEKRLHSLRRVSGGDGEQHIVASITTQYPEDRILSTDANANVEKISKVVGPDVLVASGGFATPLETNYDLGDVIYSDARPVRDALPRFQADRGGIRFITQPVLGSYANAVGVWTNTDDINAAPGIGGDGPFKNVLVAGSATVQEEYIDAVTLQLQFGNLLTRAWPELIARHNELALIQHARRAEINLLDKINTKSTAVTAASVLGLARDFLLQVKRAAATYRSRNRMDNNGQLRAIIPAWVVDAMAADLAMQMPGDDTYGASRAEIQGYLNAAGVTFVESLDQNQFGAQGAGALLDWPANFTWFLFAEGTFLFLDGGTLDLGIIRDSALVSTNDYRMFTETFEGLAKIGPEALAITSALRVNGAAAALQDTVV